MVLGFRSSLLTRAQPQGAGKWRHAQPQGAGKWRRAQPQGAGKWRRLKRTAMLSTL
jgi:hypothetical protein